MDEIEPVPLITVSQFAKVLPVGSHDLLIVVLDEGLEDFGLFRVASVNLREKGVD